MPEPIPVWWDVSADTATTTWNCGIVDAASTSPDKEFLIWNNKGGVADVSDMTNVFLTTKDQNGNDGGPVAGMTSAVVSVSIHDGNDFGAWKDIGGSDPANHATVVNQSGDGLNTIFGTANDGDPDTVASKKNYARLKLHLYVSPDAPAGALAWKTRCSFQYI